MHDPPVMLLDEPTRGLDVVGSQVVFEYLQLLRSQQKAVIICTHRLDEAERFADRFGLLHQGRLQHYGTLEELQSVTHEQTLTQMFVNLLKDPKGTTCFRCVTACMPVELLLESLLSAAISR